MACKTFLLYLYICVCDNLQVIWFYAFYKTIRCILDFKLHNYHYRRFLIINLTSYRSNWGWELSYLYSRKCTVVLSPNNLVFDSKWKTKSYKSEKQRGLLRLWMVTTMDVKYCFFPLLHMKSSAKTIFFLCVITRFFSTRFTITLFPYELFHV